MIRPATLGLGATLLICATAAPAQARPFIYRFGFDASGTVSTTTSQSFVDAPFALSFPGDTTNVAAAGGGHSIEGLTGTLQGPNGITTTLTNQFVGIQSPAFGPAQSIGYGSGAQFSLDLGQPLGTSFPGFASYDLRSAFGPMPADGHFNTPPTIPGWNVSFANASNFSFQAVAGTGSAITYEFGWTASGSRSVTTTTPFNDAHFVVSFVGDTANTVTGPSGIALEDLAGTLTGSFGISKALANYFVGIQPPGPHQSLLFGSNQSGDILDMTVDQSSPAFVHYDLASPFGPVSAKGIFLDPLFILGGLLPGVNIDGFSNFTFEAIDATPIPATLPLFVAGAIFLFGVGKIRLLPFRYFRPGV